MTFIIVKNYDNSNNGDNISKNNNNFFETLFSFENIFNNLIYLNLHLNEDCCKISFNLFKNINKFNSLKTLELGSIHLNELFPLKLKNLKY